MAPRRNVPLKAAIFASGQRQGDIAARTGIDAARLSHILHGRIVPEDREKLALARALHRPVDELFDDEVRT